MKTSIILFLIIFLSGCAHQQSSQSVESYSIEVEKGEYGYSPSYPIKVGDGDFKNGARNERIFLSSLRGPNGEKVSFKRLGSCCEFKTPNGFLGGGLLDRYEVFYEGLKEPKILYLNMYDPGDIVPPEGFILY